MSKQNIKRGEAWWGRLDYVKGNEQQEDRLSLIVSNDKQNETDKSPWKAN